MPGLKQCLALPCSQNKDYKTLYLKKQTALKLIFVLGTALVFNVSFAQTTVSSKTFGSLEFMELEHGIAQVVKGTKVKEKGSPTGTRGWLEDFVIVKVTDSVQGVLKTTFGVVYMVKAKDTVDIDVVIEWIYPRKMVSDKGEKFKSIKYTTKRPTNIPFRIILHLRCPV
jgi:hypothetical protein